jgi:hypothetical protein
MGSKQEEKRLQDLTEIGETLDTTLADMKLVTARRKLSFSRVTTPEGYKVVDNDSSMPGDTYLFQYSLTTPNTFGIDDVVGLRDNMSELARQMGSGAINDLPAGLQINAEIERTLLTQLNVDFLRKYYILVAIEGFIHLPVEKTHLNYLKFDLNVHVTFME